jgi:hypothetical protein
VDPLGRLKTGLIAIGGAVAVVGLLGLAFGWAASETTSTSGGADRTETTTEQPDPFFAAFVDALRSGDRDFLLERMHNAVIDRYGEAQCREFTAGLVDPAVSLELVDTSGPGLYDYASDGQSQTIADTYTLTADGEVGGEAGEREYHFALEDGHFRIFVDCGDALAES